MCLLTNPVPVLTNLTPLLINSAMREEQAIRVRGGLTPEEAEERVRQIFVNWTTTRLSSEQVLEIATDDSLLEESLDT